MITAEEVKECFDKIKDNPEEVNKFLISIGVKEKEHFYPRVPSVFFIDWVGNDRMFYMESEEEFIDKIVYLCKKHNYCFSYQINCTAPWVSSTSDESSIRETVKSYINEFFSGVRTSISIRGGLCNDNLIVYEVYARNEYADNYDRFGTALNAAPYIEGLSFDFINTTIDRVISSGYTKEQLYTYIDSVRFTDEEYEFMKFIYDVYEAPCCYPHEAKPLAVLD